MLRSLLLGTAVPIQHLLSNTFTPAASQLPQIFLSSAHVLQGLQQQQSFAAEAIPQRHGHTKEHQQQPEEPQPVEQQQESVEPEVSLQPQPEPQPQPQQQVVQPARQQRLEGPVLPTHIVLKAVQDWQGDAPTKHELFRQVQREYAELFPSMRQFNAHLQHIVNKNWVTTKKDPTAVTIAATASQPKKGSKKNKRGPAAPFVYVTTAVGKRVDVHQTGSQLQQEARRIADEWTAKRLPAYVTQLRAGRIPVTPDNVQLLGAEQGLARFKEQQQQAWKRAERRQQRLQQGSPQQKQGTAAAARQ